MRLTMVMKNYIKKKIPVLIAVAAVLLFCVAYSLSGAATFNGEHAHYGATLTAVPAALAQAA